jgi:hypothetical protein
MVAAAFNSKTPICLQDEIFKENNSASVFVYSSLAFAAIGCQ